MQTSKEVIQLSINLLSDLEKSIRNKTASDSYLKDVQKKLDAIEQNLKTRGYNGQDIHILYEIQTLIYGQQNLDDKTKECLEETLKVAGGADNLSSDLLREFIQNNQSLNIPFLHRSQPVVFLLSVFTLGLYFLVWFYKNWNAIRVAKSQKLWPFWRSVFSPFWAWPLFKEMLDYAATRGYREKVYSPGTLAIFFAIPLIISNGLSRIPDEEFTIIHWIIMIILLIISSVSITIVQGVINKTEDIKSDDNRWTLGQVIVIILGLILFITATVGWIDSSTGDVESPTVTSKRLQTEKLLEDFNSCSEDLSVLEANLDTTSQTSVDTYNAKYDACESIRLRQNEAADEYNSLIGQ